MHLEINDVAPVSDPFVEECRIACLHDLVAAVKVHVDPAGDVREAVWYQTPMVSKSPIDGDRIAILDVLDHQIETLFQLIPPHRSDALLHTPHAPHAQALTGCRDRVPMDGDAQPQTRPTVLASGQDSRMAAT